MVIAAALLPKWWPMLIKPSTTESLEAEDVANDKEKPVAEVTAKYQGKTVPELHSQKAEPSPTANALGKFSKADEEAAEEYLVAKVLREIAIDDIILLDADSRYRFRITIPTDTEPIISEYPDWLDVSQPKRNNDKEWIIRLKSDKDFQELKFGTVEIEADGYNTKTFTVIHKPVPASPPPSQPSTIELRFGNVSKVIELPPGGNRSIEIEVENHKESALILDNEDSPGKITVYVPSSDIPSNVLLEQLKDRLVKVPDPREDLPHRQSRGEPRN